MDSIRGKWREIREKVGKFAANHKQAVNNRRSGQGPLDIYHEAMRLYEHDNNGQTFKMQELWKILKNCTKFERVPLVGQQSSSTKRSKTSSDHDVSHSDGQSKYIDLNESGDEFVYPVEADRPMGRDKAKAKRAAASSSSVSNEYKQTLDSISERMARFNELTETRIKQKEAKREAKQKARDMKLYFMNVDHLSGEQLERFEKIKKEIAEKYNL